MPRIQNSRNLKTTYLTENALPLGKILLGIAGLLAVATGVFETDYPIPPVQYLAGTVLLTAAILEGFQILRGKSVEQYLHSLPGLLLWTSSAWILYRAAFSFLPHALLLPAGYVAWLLISYPLKQIILPLIAITLMEAGLTATHHQTLLFLLYNLLLFSVTTVSLIFYTRSKAYRRHLKKTLAKHKEDEQTKELIKDLDPFALRSSMSASLPKTAGMDDPGEINREALRLLSSSVQDNLDILKKSLALATAAILWPNTQTKEYKLWSHVSSGKDIYPGPYPGGAGIIGVLKRAGTEIEMVAVKPGSSILPYYKKQDNVGSIFAIQILEGNDNRQHQGFLPILCIDRPAHEPWTDKEKSIIRLTAQKIARDITITRNLLSMGHDKTAFQRVFLGLRELNAVLGLEAIFDRTVLMINSLVPADFIAISMLRGNEYHVVRAEGEIADDVVDKYFPKHDGLVGQTIKLNRTMPIGKEYRGPAPIFSNDHRYSNFPSLLVLPLRKEEGDSIGALVLADQKPNFFSSSRKEILELIAAQIAIKIDLGEAHEQINKLATTDGLTNLANHRTFQHGFEMMLHRAKRQSTPVCLILCDLDHFKGINDTYGHPFGDEVLRSVATVLATAVRKVDLAARYGGEEFAIVLEGSDEHGGLQMAERIRQEVQTLALRHEGNEVSVTLSLGLAVFPKDSDDKSTLIRYADQGLYAAKKGGRNRIIPWSRVQEKP